ncbi:hypothetical protein NKG05_06105 [Oerskovia sp. M15]
MDGVAPRALGRPCPDVEPAARLRLDLRARRRDRERGPRLGQLDARAPVGRERGLQGPLREVDGQRPAEWEFTPDNQLGPVRGAALPMGFNRKPLYSRGVVLVGDSGGMVSPFNGEGIAYAMQAARVAADVVAQSRARSTDAARSARSRRTRRSCAATWAATTRSAGTSCGSSSTPRSCGSVPGTVCLGRSSCASSSSCCPTVTNRVVATSSTGSSRD